MKQFYLNVFRSKDSHFIMMSTTLLISILELESATQAYLLNIKGNTNILYTLTEILITQLRQEHNLHTIIHLIDTLVYIHKASELDSVLQNQYLYIFRGLIEEIEKILIAEECRQYVEHLVQTIEYDIRTVESIKFGMYFIKNNVKVMEKYKVVFSWDLAK